MGKLFLLFILLNDSTGAVEDTTRVLNKPSRALPMASLIGCSMMTVGTITCKVSADAAYADYKKAITTADAEASRSQTENFDKWRYYTMGGSLGLAVISVILWLNYDNQMKKYEMSVGFKIKYERDKVCLGYYLH